MASPRTFRLNTPHVVLEIFEDEVILVNLEAGAYYSVEGLGSRLIALLREERPVPAILEVLEAEVEAEADVIRESVESFLSQLEKEGLIVACAAAPSPSGPRPTGARRAFVPPVLHKYTDLRDLLLLDPIHDVDDAGWPVRKPPTA
ncbi:MAG: PqqD family protein [Vicinamibacteria bacterium]|nr:PqqD family protein [Vicinamibacteria bacterium]